MGFQLVHPAEISRCEVLAHRGKQAKWRDVRASPEVLEGWLCREQSDSGSCEKRPPWSLAKPHPRAPPCAPSFNVGRHGTLGFAKMGVNFAPTFSTSP